MESQAGSHSPTHCTQLPTAHSQPVLVGGGSVEVVFELGGKGGLRLITVQASPLFITDTASLDASPVATAHV